MNKTAPMKHDYPANDPNGGVQVKLKAKLVHEGFADGTVTLELPARPVQLFFKEPPQIMTEHGPRPLNNDEEIHLDMAMQRFHKLQLASLIAELMEDDRG